MAKHPSPDCAEGSNVTAERIDGEVDQREGSDSIRERIHRRPLGRGMAMVLLMIAGILSFGAAPASAAGTVSPDVVACMRYADGSIYAGAPMYLYRWEGTWVNTGRVIYSSANGCARFADVQSNKYFRVQGYWSFGAGSSYSYYNGLTNNAYTSPGYDPQYNVSGYVYGPYRAS